MSALDLQSLGKSYGGADVVRNVSLSIRQGEFVSLLGPSGCGKTTILRMVAGLTEPTRGRILIGEEDVTRLPPNLRGLGLVFQSYALFPHLTVFENVAFGLRRRNISGSELERRVNEALALVRLSELGERYPRQLSGGQQQRVAIARAVAPKPRVLLFDEPLSNLDAQLRDEMQIELKFLQQTLGMTTLFVTHDQAEALSLSDRVAVMERGIVQQFGTPEEIYHHPETGFVASFIGKPNKLSGVLVERDGRSGKIRLPGGVLLAAGQTEGCVGDRVDVFIRPEAIELKTGLGEAGDLEARIILRSFSGANVQFVLRIGVDVEIVADAASSRASAVLVPGDPVVVSIASRGVFAMLPETYAA
jgi:iron(III) transport system ATP-binding protein/putative spermidine/putrescine transport system ATP-binding protein